MEFSLKTLTPLWCGGVDTRSLLDRIHETGLLGSLRWWYEAVVRGLGGYACDPGSETARKWHCPGTPDTHCVACEMFGCTGWGGKFRFRMLDTNKNPINEPLDKDTEVLFQFLFTKGVADEEKWLLIKTLEIICNCGSIGGRTVYKPTEYPLNITKANKPYHKDYGIIEKVSFPPYPSGVSIGQMEAFVRSFRVQNKDGSLRPQQPAALQKAYLEFPDMRYLLFFKGSYLNRLEMNTLMGLDPQGHSLSLVSDPYREQKEWLRGRIGKSKLLFSFSTRNSLWCYSKVDGKFYGQLKSLLNSALPSCTLIEGKQLLQ